VNTTLAATPLRRATSVTLAPGTSVSSCRPATIVAAALTRPKPRPASLDDLKARLKVTRFAKYPASDKAVLVGRVHYNGDQSNLSGAFGRRIEWASFAASELFLLASRQSILVAGAMQMTVPVPALREGGEGWSHSKSAI
jgi:hypothetical protein